MHWNPCMIYLPIISSRILFNLYQIRGIYLKHCNVYQIPYIESKQSPVGAICINIKSTSGLHQILVSGRTSCPGRRLCGCAEHWGVIKVRTALGFMISLFSYSSAALSPHFCRLLFAYSNPTTIIYSEQLHLLYRLNSSLWRCSRRYHINLLHHLEYWEMRQS